MEEIQLKDICDLDNGYAFKSDDYVDNSNTLNCRMSNIRPDGSFDILYSAKYLPDEFAEKYKDYILHDGDLIIAMTDMAGDPKILGVPTVVDTQGFCLLLNQRVGRLRFIRDGVNADYLKLALQCPKVRTYLKRFAGGGVQLNVSKKDILSAPVCMRNKEEQNHIAGLFKRVLEVKTKREQELQLLDDIIKARFVEMFGDPVSDTKEWGQKPLKEMLESIRYGTSTPPEFSRSGYAFIRATNIKNGRIVDNDMKYIPKEEADRLAKCKLSGGEILIVRSGVNAGDTCVVTKDYIGQYAGYDMILVLNKELNSVFFNVLVNTSYMDKVVKPLTRRAAQPHLNSEQVQSFPIIQVPIELQNEFSSFVNQVDKSKVAVQKALDETQLLFDSLMQEYFG